MSELLLERLVQAARQELARALGELCSEVGAAESSILLPSGGTDLVFFASTNVALTQPDAPHVPITASFSGIAYRTGQTMAVADAASQAPHFRAVDDHVASRTREFAAIPLADRTVLGVLTLVNRAASGTGEAHPFDIAELRRAQTVASEMAHVLARLPGLTGAELHDTDLTRKFGAEFGADLALLKDGERRVVHSLVNALIQNRTE